MPLIDESMTRATGCPAMENPREGVRSNTPQPGDLPDVFLYDLLIGPTEYGPGVQYHTHVSSI